MIGILRKLKTQLDTPVAYQLPVGDDLQPLNDLIGKPVKLDYTGSIYCIHCGRKTKKSYNQGFCFPCLRDLAQCDTCIIKPETCHYEAGTCREPEWAQDHCFQPHYVYLANSSGLKVGITRENQIPIRWMDQGAIQALPIAKVANRYISGLFEVILAQHIADKTNWRAMLKGQADPMDLADKRDALLATCQAQIEDLSIKMGPENIELLQAETVAIEYPVTTYPTKVSTHNFDKCPQVAGILMGIKGQYLMLDTGVINIRKFAGYEIEFTPG